MDNAQRGGWTLRAGSDNEIHWQNGYGMTHAFFRPQPPLDALVDFFWVSGGSRTWAPRERVLPTGSQSLVIHLEDAPLRVYADPANGRVDEAGALLCGARSSPLLIDTAALGATVGVAFKPGGARAFFDVPADALAERALSLDTLWGRSANALRERLMEPSSASARIAVLEAALLKQSRRAFELAPALQEALDAFEQPDLGSVADVNRETGLSAKRLLALFRDAVGLRPKAFWRVRRFRAALRALEQGASRGPALANELGYYDQAHFLREFRSLSGGSPREYFATRVPGTDHVSVYG